MNLDRLFEAAAKEITGNYRIVISFNGKNRTFAYPGHKIRSLEAQLTKTNVYTPKTVETIIRSIMRIESNLARGLKIFGKNFKDDAVDFEVTTDEDGKQVVKNLVVLHEDELDEVSAEVVGAIDKKGMYKLGTDNWKNSGVGPNMLKKLKLHITKRYGLDSVAGNELGDDIVYDKAKGQFTITFDHGKTKGQKATVSAQILDQKY